MKDVLAEDTDWNTCPICGSGQIEGGSIEIDSIEAYQTVSCLHCEATWREVYAALQRDGITTKEHMFEVSFRFFTERTYVKATDISAYVEDAAKDYEGRIEYIKVVG